MSKEHAAKISSRIDEEIKVCILCYLQTPTEASTLRGKPSEPGKQGETKLESSYWVKQIQENLLCRNISS
jgi:hypothetical protein